MSNSTLCQIEQRSGYIRLQEIYESFAFQLKMAALPSIYVDGDNSAGLSAETDGGS